MPSRSRTILRRDALIRIKPSFRKTLRSFLYGDCRDGTWLAFTSKQLSLSDLLVGILLAIRNVTFRVALSMQGVSHQFLGPHLP